MFSARPSHGPTRSGRRYPASKTSSIPCARNRSSSWSLAWDDGMPEITSTVLPAPAHRVTAGISDRCEMTSVMSTGISPRAAHSIKLSAVDPPPDTSTAALNL